MAKATFDAPLLPHLIDVLMAAAYADETLDGREVEAVEKLIVGLIKDADELPEDLKTRIDKFDHKEFKLATAMEGLGEMAAEQRRAILEMLADLSEADEEIDLAEDEFLREVGTALGASDEDLEGLTVEVEIVLEPKPSRKPPPPPPSKKS